MKISAMFLASALVVALTSCRTVESGERGFRDLPAAERDGMLKRSERLGDGILRALQSGDYALLKSSLPGELSEKMTEKDFRTSCRNFREKFGAIKDHRLLTALDTPAFGNLIWVVTFVRRGTNGAEIRRQLLFRLVTMEVDGKVQVVSMGFM